MGAVRLRQLPYHSRFSGRDRGPSSWRASYPAPAAAPQISWLERSGERVFQCSPASARARSGSVLSRRVSVLTLRKVHNGPAARRVLGASVPHGSCAQSQRFLTPSPSKSLPSLVPHRESMLANATAW
jgi:hypothetical protein